MIRRALRIAIPVLVILGWVTAAGVGGPYFGRISEVASNDQASYLPASAEATEVSTLIPEFAESDEIPAIVVVARDGGLTDSDLRWLDEFAAGMPDVEGVADEVSPAIRSDDGEAVQVVVPIRGEVDETVGRITLALAGAPDGLTAYITGPAGFTADLVAGFRGIDGVLLLAALGAVLVILLVVYRSPLLPLLVLGTALFSLAASILAVWWLAAADIVQINGQVQGILFILVIGAATDYSLLYVSRYREALRDTQRLWDATGAALRASVEPILASGLTVIAGLLCLLFSDLNSNKALGPVAAIGIGFALLGALTLLPALLLAAGRTAFWPRRPAFGTAHPEPVTGRGLWPRVGRMLARRPRRIWVVSTLALFALAVGLTQLHADGVPQSDLVLGASPARDGQVLLGDHFSGGSGSPAVIVGDADAIDELADAVVAVDGVDSVVALSAESPAGTVNVGSGPPSPSIPTGPGGETVPFKPTVIDGRIMLQATLSMAADSPEAEATVLALRTAVDTVDPKALVGGVTAIAVDTNATAIRDRTVIIPLVLAVILMILMLLLRAVIAPVLLVATVILSFAASLGVAAFAFNWLFGFSGADPAVPLFSFVFLVALGVDYNIFLMTRVREEAMVHGTREGVLRGLALTGGVITSAGVVLAATFAALAVIPILFLVQIAFIVAFGVLLDTLLVRSLLVPAISLDLDRAIWWPSRLGRSRQNESGEEDR